MIPYTISPPLDSYERTAIHREIIKNKKILYRLYCDWYGIFLEEMKDLPGETMVEIGSGGGFLKELAPRVICTDVVDAPGNDMTFSALEMPFADASVGGLFLLDTMHHIPDSMKFLREASRVLEKNGKMILVEPANTRWGRFIYTKFHHEPFDPQGGWEIPGEGPMTGANGALPWIVFVRDRELFTRTFPELKIERIEYTTPFTYLLSGGVSRRQSVPGFMYRPLRFLDRSAVKLWKELSMFMVIRVVRQ